MLPMGGSRFLKIESVAAMPTQFAAAAASGVAEATRAPPSSASTAQSLTDLITRLEDYTPTIPDSIVAFYMHQAGLDGSDPRIVRLIGLAAQKFISDVTNDALQYYRVRQSSQPAKAKQRKDRRVVLTVEDLSAALKEYGIIVRKPPYCS